MFTFPHPCSKSLQILLRSMMYANILFCKFIKYRLYFYEFNSNVRASNGTLVGFTHLIHFSFLRTQKRLLTGWFIHFITVLFLYNPNWQADHDRGKRTHLTLNCLIVIQKDSIKENLIRDLEDRDSYSVWRTHDVTSF